MGLKLAERFGNDDENSMNALQVLEPGGQTVYTIEVAAQLAQVPRRPRDVAGTR